MSKYLVYGPAGCGKQVYAEKNILTTIYYRTIHCYDIERFDETARQVFYSQIKPIHEEDTDEILVVGIDTVPKLWQRGLLTKMEEELKHTVMVFTARSLSKVDSAFQSRCIGKRVSSRYMNNKKMLSSIASTDYDIEMDDIPLNIWNVENPGDYIRDLLLLKAMEPIEFVKYALDELQYQDLDLMEKIIKLSTSITNDSSWYDLEWWVNAVSKLIMFKTQPGPEPEPLGQYKLGHSLNFVHLLKE